MSNTKENILTKLSDVGFTIFYVALFIFQTLPSFAFTFLECSNPWLWVACGVGLAAMVIQGIKFPCATTMIWRCCVIAATVASIIGL